MSKILNQKIKSKKGVTTIPKEILKWFPIERIYLEDGIINVGNIYSIIGMTTKITENNYIEILDIIDSNFNLQISYIKENINLYNDLYFGIPIEDKLILIILSIEANSIKEASNKLFEAMKKISYKIKINLFQIPDYISVLFKYYNNQNITMPENLFLNGTKIQLGDFLKLGLPEYGKNYIKIGDTYTRCYYFREMPIMNKINNLNFKFDVTIHITKNFKYSNKIETNYIAAGFYLNVSSKTKKELQEKDNIIMYFYKKSKCNIEVVTYQPENVLQTTFPIGMDKINIKMLMNQDKLTKNLKYFF